MRIRAVFLSLALVASLVATQSPVGAQDPDLVVTPSTNLLDGQLVQLDQSVVPPVFGIPAGINLSTCVDDYVGQRPCNRSGWGIFFAETLDSARVARFVDTPAGIADCAVVACSLVYTETICLPQFPGGCDFLTTDPVEAPVSFQPGPGVGTIGYWGDGDEVRVIATGLDAPAPSFAFAAQCAFRSDGAFLCGGGTGAIESNFDGDYDSILVLQENFTQGALSADCSVDACFVVVVVLGAGYALVDAGSTYRIWNELQ